MKLLNIGCGCRFREGWVNIDRLPSSPLVQACDVLSGLPFPENSFDVVYHSHILEHFPREKAPDFLRECYRLLKRGGIIRVVVPDLEQIARSYLDALDKASGGDVGWRHNYDWMMIELFDQMVRNRSGGTMYEYITQENIPNKEFVRKRMGSFAFPASRSTPDAELKATPVRHRLVGYFRNIARRVRERALRTILGPADYKALDLGRFRKQGEAHLWMYDRFSLAKNLENAGFKDVRAAGPAESRIPDWVGYNLDTEQDGTVYKPDSMYMEAVKP